MINTKLWHVKNYVELYKFHVLLVSPGQKRPHHVHPKGLYNATNNYEELEQLINQYPNANIGIRTGEISGISVLDFDDYENNIKSLEELGYKPPPTLKWETPHGIHYLVKYDVRIRTTQNFLPKLDIKNDKGYVLAPPSKVPCDGSKHQDNQPCNKYLYKTLHTSQENIKILPFEEWQQ